MLSLLTAITGGEDWLVYYNILTPLGSGLTALLFVFFVGFSQLAVWNIVTGIFIENAMKYAQPSRDEASIEVMRKELELSKELR
eukprot:CAMPEP_0180657982 /NCGR_PEP_ID=MMETSP1037_2-20121125/56745_1 /TAXON_ID=632150 /ORGANISM="Azadinium spinosum, Strain 3D9" /LENGTH=83 /DNA_ID=CAMNT_0022684807 /DNA_START=37 /DNA_END=285 /DNA_ORIENTATION=+